VTYTKKVTNPGTVPLSNVQISDDKCGPVRIVSGDVNGDKKLDPSETWTYTCSATLRATTTNTVIVSGDANGLTARDFAIATVTVASIVPGLPKTGAATLPASAGTAGVLAAIAVGAGFLLSRSRKNRIA
jgi:LPXTG-motif cell wall-anchored protein